MKSNWSKSFSRRVAVNCLFATFTPNSRRTKKNCCGDAAVTPVALARRPRLPAATRQPPVIRHSSLVISQQWLAFAQRQWFPGRPPFLRSGGWGVALWRAAAVLLPSRALVSSAAGGNVSLAKSRCPCVPRSLVLCLRASVVLLSTLLLCHVYMAMSIFCRVNVAYNQELDFFSGWFWGIFEKCDRSLFKPLCFSHSRRFNRCLNLSF
ncbi:hypothetical protein NIES4073_03860 (plasmid) [Kalymmatonema gypsitolerans NIES-4073]|nr:hypothetical protein NIES4073_03860 [Scytonema sp. NIES-4073]